MGLNLCDSCRADCRHERNPREIVVKCGAYKPPMTNADRIRAMSDEGLACFLKKVVPFNCDCCAHRKPCRLEEDTETVDYSGKYDCYQGTLAWLRQTEEGGGDGNE